MLKSLQNKPILFISLVVIVMLIFSIDTLPVSIMEARNFITAREMITDGNWLLTTMNGEARYEKPPLPTWFSAIFGLIFGIKSVVAFRFPTLILITIIGVFTFLLSKKLVNNTSHSLINGLIVITSFYVIGITLEAPWDIYTHGFMLVAIYYLFQLFGSEKNNTKHILLASFFMGCSILSKGPISIYALLLPFLLAYGFSYKFKNVKSKLLPFLIVFVLAIIIGGWWFLFVRLTDPETFISIAERETSNWHSYNVKPFYYYWSFFTQSGIWTIPAFISLLYPYLKTRVSNLKAYKFSLFWTLFAVILLSVIPEKKSRYLMPVLIPLAINTGFYIEYLIRRFKDIKDKRETIPVYFNFGLIALIGIAIPIIVYLQLEGEFSNILLFIVATIVVLSISLLLIYQLKKKNIEHSFLLTVMFFVSVFMLVLPLLKPIIGTANKPISNLKQDNFKVYGFNYVSPETIWQYGDKIPPIKLEDGTFNFPKEHQFGMLVNGISPEDWEVLQSKYNVQEVDEFDLNAVPSDSKKYNGRLNNYYYILTKN
jgi:4-amino-4-deoxy-L-arabinose transferase-like glycosyltransferase